MQAARAVLYSIIEDILSTKHPDLRFVETVWKNSKDSDGAWGWHDRGSTENQETIRIDGNLLENVARLLDEHGLGIHESGGMDEYYPILLLYIMTELHERAHYIIPESLPSIRNTLKSVGGVYNSRVTIGEFRFCSGRTTSRIKRIVGHIQKKDETTGFHPAKFYSLGQLSVVLGPASLC
ncbi:hypothetical protein Moror_10592 [Moniliophthora roreri MCA 2997]|uniref:Uncharacterized protein n=1 Tax=Moniliophthora roreri (strain MCA 2997) TaxID=1381753 RepID=V2WY33_MONRO|nr:hypothetical protein Moror_10592 [Moniliophthora roreri MCA 2997]